MMLLAYLALALALGMLPASMFSGRGHLFVDGPQIRARFFLPNPGDNRRFRRRWWKSAAIWVDPVRGVLIGWLVSRALMLETSELDKETYIAVELGCYAMMLFIVFWQTCGRGREGQTLAPFLLIGGLLASGFGLLIGLSATVLALLALFATQSVALGFTVMAVTTLASGLLMIGPGLILLTATALGLVPLAKSFLMRQPLVVAIRG